MRGREHKVVVVEVGGSQSFLWVLQAFLKHSGEQNPAFLQREQTCNFSIFLLSHAS